MGLDGIDLTLVSHDLVQDLKWDPQLRGQFERDEASVLDQYDLTLAERRAIEDRNFRALYDLGFHPYLGAQFARILFANNRSGATSAVQQLLASIREEPTAAVTDERSS